MKITHRLCNGIIKLMLLTTCKIEKEDLKKIPESGPYILVVNHINFLEAPILYLFLRPRRTIALGKEELWNSRIGAFLMNLWEVLPIKRGGADIGGMKKALDVLKEGDFLCLAPEGTRSRDGQLKKGKTGVILFAQKGNVPIIPVAHWGGESFFPNLKRIKRTRFSIRVGEPIEIRNNREAKMGPKERQIVADEIMISLARLMPEQYHGYYKEKVLQEPEYLFPVRTR